MNGARLGAGEEGERRQVRVLDPALREEPGAPAGGGLGLQRRDAGPVRRVHRELERPGGSRHEGEGADRGLHAPLARQAEPDRAVDLHRGDGGVLRPFAGRGGDDGRRERRRASARRRGLRGADRDPDGARPVVGKDDDVLLELERHGRLDDEGADLLALHRVGPPEEDGDLEFEPLATHRHAELHAQRRTVGPDRVARPRDDVEALPGRLFSQWGWVTSASARNGDARPALYGLVELQLCPGRQPFSGAPRHLDTDERGRRARADEGGDGQPERAPGRRRRARGHRLEPEAGGRADRIEELVPLHRRPTGRSEAPSGRSAPREASGGPPPDPGGRTPVRPR